ncbi:Anoctamin-9 Transmembrane protein 16J [Triplophysa tibetana]|uniref:Anoctamin n=1 Tax=Triplophysa tibetana TaxID=1572043 RepID=A0A5A9PSN0_9TELE|nr:Anoctamin-9 Transmembrane protein 16J [Triplophysa tibetana]
MMELKIHRRQGSIDFLETCGVVNENGTENESLPPVKTRDDETVFYCIRAPNEIFEMYRYLLKVSDACNWSCEQQGTIPQSTRNYLGEKVALYFLWLGWYTFLLVPASLIGIVVFLYGLAYYNTSPLIQEVCHSNTIMCPLCDNTCNVWRLSDTCMYAKVSFLFDNAGTVFFATFMAVWTTVFLEFWKRHRSSYVCEWKVFDWCEEEEELILEIVNNADCKPKIQRHSYLRSTIVLVLVTLMLLLIIGLTHALVVFRVIATVLLAEHSSLNVISENSQTVALMLGAVLHYITITVMTRVNCKVAIKMTEIENKQSQSAIERSFTVKMFTFQFFTLFSSLIYTAFFLGRINGHPGGYVRLSGRWRLEECHPSGCLTDLFIQMSIIMVLKQTFNNIFEYSGPWFKRWMKKKKTQKLRRRCINCYKKECMNPLAGSELCDNCKLENLHRNYGLNEIDCFSLFNEFLEMVIQFSFTTIFVAAFPLAPLLALLNNIIEIRLDAIKMVSLERRLVATKANDIGVWTDVLETISVFAVIANGLVIGISSDFIPRLVYQYYYGPCATGNDSGIDCMEGYIIHTLSTANISDERVRQDFSLKQMVTNNGINVTHCSYRDYRSNEDFSLTNQFWVILAARLIFIILFEHVVVIFKCVASWFVPNSPLDVRNERLLDKLSRLKEELSCHTDGGQPDHQGGTSPEPTCKKATSPEPSPKMATSPVLTDKMLVSKQWCRISNLKDTLLATLASVKMTALTSPAFPGLQPACDSMSSSSACHAQASCSASSVSNSGPGPHLLHSSGPPLIHHPPDLYCWEHMDAALKGGSVTIQALLSPV